MNECRSCESWHKPDMFLSRSCCVQFETTLSKPAATVYKMSSLRDDPHLDQRSRSVKGAPGQGSEKDWSLVKNILKIRKIVQQVWFLRVIFPILVYIILLMSNKKSDLENNKRLWNLFYAFVFWNSIYGLSQVSVHREGVNLISMEGVNDLIVQISVGK